MATVSRLGRWLGLTLFLTGASTAAAVAMFDVKPRRPRPTLDEALRREIASTLQPRLLGHVEALAGRIGERHLGRPAALAAAAAYVGDALAAAGLAVREEPVEAGGRWAANLVADLAGTTRREEWVLVGAHYDTVPGCPGADDNATGVAVLLELARALAGDRLARSVRLVAFVNEEPPYFQTAAMGSRVHARGARARGERIVAMLSLESLGYYRAEPGTQRYPFPLGLLYPDAGRFLAVVGNLRSRGLVRAFLDHFTAVTDFPVEGAATLSALPGVGWSDHWAFWQEGYPAIMLTDTAPYRYPAYHAPDDRADRLTPEPFARSAQGIIEAIRRLADSP